MSTATLTRATTPLDANWRLLGNCLDLDPDFMHPDDGDRSGQAAAKLVCHGCPVQGDCFTESIRLNDFNGVRAGMSGAERRVYGTQNGVAA